MSTRFLLLLLFSNTVYVCTDDVDDVKANGSRSAQELPTGFAHVNQVSSGSPAQSAVSTENIQYCTLKHDNGTYWNITNIVLNTNQPLSTLPLSQQNLSFHIMYLTLCILRTYVHP